MKTFSLISLLLASLFSTVGLAGTIYVEGSGYEYGMCTETDFYFCSQSARDRSRANCLRDADFRCSLSQGRLEIFSETYYDYCNPFSYPSGQTGAVSVYCRTSCRARCQVN
jgi:hypothetical protein